MMLYQQGIDNLIQEASPSIQYRIRKEILKESIETAQMVKLQDDIFQGKDVQELVSLQQENGWIGGRFHGEREPESVIRFLIEKGIEGNNSVIKRALEAIISVGLSTNDDALSFGVGKKLDFYHLGGTQMVKACVFAYAGCDHYDFVKHQIIEALFGFEFVLGVTDMDQVCRLHKNNFYVFNDDMFWPSIYHLRLLAFTTEWKSQENRKKLTDVFNKMISLAPVPEIKLLYKGQRISPAKMEFINLFTKDINNFLPKEWMLWFHWAELVARLGIIKDIPVIKEQVNQLIEHLECKDGMFCEALSHFYFTKWTSYTGLSLDSDWKSKKNKIDNLTFRSLLILHYADFL